MEPSIKHPIIDVMDQSTIESVRTSVNRFMIQKAIDPESINPVRDLGNLEDVIEAYELAAAHEWMFALDLDPKNEHKREVFRNICTECLSLTRILPIPERPVEMFVHVLKMLAYAYLGERWEDMRRYLKEHPRIWDVGVNEDWVHVVFSGIYFAILHLTRKESWEDMTKVSEIISELRQRQHASEGAYLDSVDKNYKAGAAHELASMYHLAKAVEIVCMFMMQGKPPSVEEEISYHIGKAKDHSRSARSMELDIMLELLHATFVKMTRNSIWVAARSAGPRAIRFVETITKAGRPVFELLYPQRRAILEKGLLDLANKAVVVNLPTSSGKTLMAEFRILQAISLFGDDARVVYVVPTRALANQITARLRHDLNELGIIVEKMSGAVEIDSFEENMLTGQWPFHVLVTTPEKLQLLIRYPESGLADSLVLAIIDEAHNIADESRGLKLEILISIIKNDCNMANLLLLTPFIPNSQEIASWLSPGRSKSIEIGLEWRPNEMVVGSYSLDGTDRNTGTTVFKPLITSAKTIELDDKIPIGEVGAFSLPAGSIQNTKYKLSALLATQIARSRSFLVLVRNPQEAWRTADLISNNMDEYHTADNDDVRLVAKFAESELGSKFPLASYLKKGIGIHHSGLPEEMRMLIEWLMETGLLRVMVATTTIAQGVNFPVSGVLISSTTYPYGKSMPTRDFWNLAGRVGRIDQPSVGIVGLAAKSDGTDDLKNAKYVRKAAEDLVSTLTGMVNEALRTSDELDLSRQWDKPRWSIFLQYVAHMKRQATSLEQFVANLEMILGSTYGFSRLPPDNQTALIDAVKRYAQSLDSKPHLALLSDITGFAPETVEKTLEAIKGRYESPDYWNSKNFFAPASNKMASLVNVMLENITEVRDELKIKVSNKELTNEDVGEIVSKWVSGESIPEIAISHFGGDDRKAITTCVSNLYRNITNAATWGVAGIQRISDLGLDVKDDQRRTTRMLPAMIYYGVNSEEAVLMRMYSVPRNVSKKIGDKYREYTSGDPYVSGAHKILPWLKETPEEFWRPDSGIITGDECKRVWQKITGIM